MNLFEIATHYRQLIDMLSGDDEIQQDQIDDMLAANGDVLNIKVANVCAVIKTMRATAKAHKDIAKYHNEKGDHLDSGADRLEQWAATCLKAAGVTEAGTVEHSCKLPKPRASLDVVDFSIVPEPYWRVVPARHEIDKVAAKDALLAGTDVPGCAIKYNQTLKVI